MAHTIEQIRLHRIGRHLDVLIARRELARPLELDQCGEGGVERVLAPLELRLEELLAGLEDRRVRGPFGVPERRHRAP